MKFTKRTKHQAQFKCRALKKKMNTKGWVTHLMNCKRQTKKEARTACRVLKKKMNTKGWVMHLWYNKTFKEWGHALKNSRCGLYIHVLYTYDRRGCYKFTYRCSLDFDGNGNKHNLGERYWRSDDSYKDPNVAVAIQIECARAFVDKVDYCVEKAESCTVQVKGTR